MSAMNNFKTLLLCFMLLVCTGLQAVSINLIEGAVPVGSPNELIEEGIRLGSTLLLKRAWCECAAASAESGANAAYLELGRIYFYLSLFGQSTELEHETARNLACRAVADNPKSSDAHRALGLVLAGEGAFLDAYQELTLALYLNPANEFLIYDLASLHISLRQPQKAIEYLNSVRCKSAWPYVLAAMANAQMHKRGRAIVNLFKARYLGFADSIINSMLEELMADLRY